MKVGTLSIYNLDNYGTLLQGYALQETVEQMGHSCHLISYNITHSPFTLLRFFIYSLTQNGLSLTLKGVKKYLTHQKALPSLPVLTPSHDIFEDFRDNYLHLTEITYNPKTLMSHPPGYDAYIVGSDNIWVIGDEIGISDGGARFYLDFVSQGKKRISYAASMGNPEIPHHFQKRLVELLQNIDFISVRERTTTEVLSQLTQRDVAAVCDPTLLLASYQWDKLISPSSLSQDEGPYILVYVIHPYAEDAPPFQFARRLSADSSYRIKYIGYNYVNSNPIFNTVPVPEFLESFKNAAYVITNTFHGTMFSLIFRKNFYVFKPKAGPIRISDVLETVALSNRMVETIEEAISLPMDIDYSESEGKIERFRSESLLWLRNALDE